MPGVVVIHENRGTNPNTEDVVRRLAVANFVAFAPDALTPVGGYPNDEEKAAQLFRTLDSGKVIEDFVSAARYVKALPDCTGRVGAVGFCFGGGMANILAVRIADLAAAAPFYGRQPDAADTARIKAPLLIHYAGLDERLNVGWPVWETALKANGVRHEMHNYPGVQHGFHNDSTPRYDEAAAKLAWQRTVDFFNKNVRSS